MECFGDRPEKIEFSTLKGATGRAKPHAIQIVFFLKLISYRIDRPGQPAIDLQPKNCQWKRVATEMTPEVFHASCRCMLSACSKRFLLEIGTSTQQSPCQEPALARKFDTRHRDRPQRPQPPSVIAIVFPMIYRRVIVGVLVAYSSNRNNNTFNEIQQAPKHPTHFVWDLQYKVGDCWGDCWGACGRFLAGALGRGRPGSIRTRKAAQAEHFPTLSLLDDHPAGARLRLTPGHPSCSSTRARHRAPPS